MSAPIVEQPLEDFNRTLIVSGARQGKSSRRSPGGSELEAGRCQGGILGRSGTRGKGPEWREDQGDAQVSRLEKAALQTMRKYI